MEEAQRILQMPIHLLGLLHQLLDPVMGANGASCLSDEDLAILVNDKDASLSARGGLLQANGSNERVAGVAEKRVGKLLLLLEGGVGLGRVGAQAVDGEAVSGQRLIRVAEEAHLGGAWEFFEESAKCDRVENLRKRVGKRG